MQIEVLYIYVYIYISLHLYSIIQEIVHKETEPHQPKVIYFNGIKPFKDYFSRFYLECSLKHFK